MSAPISVDFEAAVIAEVAAHAAAFGIDGWPVRTLRPGPRETRPAEWFRFDLGAGQGRETLVTDRFTLIVEAYAATQARAVYGLNRFRALILDANGTLFGAVDQAGPIRLPDPLIPEQVRYTARIAVRARATLTA